MSSSTARKQQWSIASAVIVAASFIFLLSMISSYSERITSAVVQPGYTFPVKHADNIDDGKSDSQSLKTPIAQNKTISTFKEGEIQKLEAENSQRLSKVELRLSHVEKLIDRLQNVWQNSSMTLRLKSPAAEGVAQRSKDGSRQCENLQRQITSSQQCIRTQLETIANGSLWNELHKVVGNCSGDLTRVLNVQFFHNKDDVKGFIDFANGTATNRNSCTALTIGIGGDILAEEQLVKAVPFCKLYGADPIYDSGIPFQALGKFIQVAISNETGNRTASVLPKPSEIFTYSNLEVPNMEFVEFLQSSEVNESIVDFLFLDGEGAEYQLLPYFDHETGKLSQNELTICEVSVELHGPLKSYDLDTQRWELLVRQFLLDSDFLVLWMAEPGNHHRMFAMNINSSICFDKFLSGHCTSTD